MKSTLSKQLQQLARQQRNSLWLKRLSTRMPVLLWLSASILLLGGGIHQLWLVLNPLAVLSLAILPSLLVLLWLAVSEKPALEEGAAAADRLFGANSLFVSSWELTRSPAATDGIATLLLGRTENALAGWTLLTRERPPRTLNPASLAAFTLGLAGLFFLLLPPYVQTGEYRYAARPSSSAALNQGKQTTMALSELFMAERKNSTQLPIQPSVQRLQPDSSSDSFAQIPQHGDQAASAMNGESIAAGDGLSSSLVEQSLTTPDVLRPDSAQANSKKTPARSAGSESSHVMNTLTSQAEPFERISLIDIETGSDAGSTAFDTARAGDKLIATPPELSDSGHAQIQHTHKPAQTESTTLLNAEQRALVSRYFKQLDKINEPNK